MLITTCTHCLARFRVTPPQLNAKQGQVRCGRCRNIFNGFEALERYPDDDTGSRLLAAREAELKVTKPIEESESVPLEELPDPASELPAEKPPPPPPPPQGTISKLSNPDSKPLETKPRRPIAAAFEVEVPPPKRPARAWTFAAVMLAAGAELAIQLRLETRSIKATGYELLLFYP